MSQSNTPTTRRQLRDRGETASNADDGKKQSGSAEKTEKDKEKVVAEASSPAVGQKAKMRTRLSTGTLIMNGTSTFKEKDLKSASPATEGSKSQKDASPSASKRRASTVPSTSETSPPVPPKRRKVGRNDGSGEGNQNDYFCWLCHKEDTSVYCELCPRVYHLKCLGVTTVPKEWVCPECEKTMRAECADTKSKAMSMISIDTLCLLLRYALDRMRQPGSEAFEKPVDQAAFPTYSDYVFHPMDFTMLEKNIKKKEYGCTEAFLADAKWILHNCIVFNGLHNKLTNVARNIINRCKHEMSEIETCPECYQNSCVKGDASWFIDPCHPPHTLVWAKLKGYPFWPAKALREVNGQVDVRFFGAHDRSWVPVSQVFLLSKESPAPVRNKGGFGTAMEELKQHIKNIRDKFGTFVYPPHRTSYDKRHVYMKQGSSVVAPKRFKPAVLGKVATKSKDSWGPDRVSAASKTASALKTKYSSLATKKSAAGTLARGQATSEPAPQDGSDSAQPGTSQRGDAEKTESLPGSPTATSRFCLVSVTDVIQEKIAKIKELETEESVEEINVEDSDVEGVEQKKGEQSEKGIKEEEGTGEAKGTEVSRDTGGKEGEKEPAGQKKKVDRGDKRKQEESKGDKIEKMETGSEQALTVESGSGHTQAAQEIREAGKTLSAEETATPESASSTRERRQSNEMEGKSLQVNDASEGRRAPEGNHDTTCENSSTLSVSVSSENPGPSSEKTSSETAALSSPKSSEYKDSLTKTIEACKDKLGITDLEEIAEEDITITSDVDSDTENMPESKISEVEDDTQKKSVSKPESGIGSVITPASQEVGMEHRVCAQDESDSLDTAVAEDAQAQEILRGAGGGSSNLAVNPDNSTVVDLCTDPSEKNAGEKSSTCFSDMSSAASEGKRSDGKGATSQFLAPASESVHGNRFTVIKPTPGSEGKDGISSQPGTGSDNLVSDSEAGPKASTETTKPVSDVVKVVSKTAETVEGMCEGATGTSKPASDAATVERTAKPVAESLKMAEPSESALGLGVIVDKTRRVGADLSRSVIQDSTSVTHTGETDVEMMQTTPEHPAPLVGASPIRPITVDKDVDDGEPDLLMEVETEAEHDQLIIDLEEDDLDLREIGSAGKGASSSKKAVSGGFVKKLAPSPSVMRDIQKAHNEMGKSSSGSCRKTKADTPGPIVSSRASSSSSSSSSSSVLFTTSVQSLPRPDAGSTQKTRPHMFSPFQVPSLPPEPPQSSVRNASDKVTPNSNSGPTTSRLSGPGGDMVEGDTTLSPAALKIVNKYSSEIQQKLAELCREVMTTAPPEQEKSRCYQQEMDRLKWIHQQEIAEIKHNYKLTVAEMKAVWEAEKLKSNNELKRRLNKEKEEAVMATKKKQWCAHCWKEAIYYCCWNTSYCSYHCQQQHWPAHLPNCTQAQTTTSALSATTTTTITPATAAPPPPSAGTPGALESDVMVMSSGRGQGGNDVKGGEKDERIQAQKFNIPPPSSSAAISAPGDAAWRGRMPLPTQTLGQNIHFMPLSGSQQTPQAPPVSQPLQQLQYLQSLGSGPTLFQPSSQVQLLAPRPGLNTVLPPGTVMPPNAAVFPILRPSQPTSTPGSQSIMINRPMQYQQLWK